MRIIRKSQVVFINDRIEKSFNDLSENSDVKKWIRRAMDDLKQNAFCAVPVPKRLIPLEYIQKYNVKNLWKYDLPDGWRLVYSIANPTKIEVVSIILEWFDHKDYERRFSY